MEQNMTMGIFRVIGAVLIGVFVFACDGGAGGDNEKEPSGGGPPPSPITSAFGIELVWVPGGSFRMVILYG